MGNMKIVTNIIKTMDQGDENHSHKEDEDHDQEDEGCHHEQKENENQNHKIIKIMSKNKRK